MQLIFQNDHVVINLVGVLFGGCYRRSYFELCVCARGQWKVRILRIAEHVRDKMQSTTNPWDEREREIPREVQDFQIIE